MIDLNPEYWALSMFGSLLVGLFLGHPLAFVLGGLAVIFGLLGWGPTCLSMFINRTYGVMDNFVLTAIPLFIFMAQILTRARIADELFDALRYLFGSLRGGIAIAMVVFSTLFGACTGIIGASVVTMGLLGLPIMLNYGYDKRLSSGVICAGGSLGILIPPSIMLIIMGNEAGISVGKLFAGAIIPGLILSSLYIIYILIKCYIRPDLAPALSAEERASVSTRKLIIMTLKSLIPPLLLIAGVLGTIFTGTATPTEAAAVGALVALLLTIAYRRFSWRDLYESMIETAKTTSMALIIVVGATCFTGVFLGIGGGDAVANFILGIGMGKWGTFIIMMIILFVLGMFLDWIGIVMITFPVFLPIADQMGFDKLWFVVTMAVMLQDCFLTPPFGYALFFLRGVAPEEVTTADIYWGAFPFWRLMEVGLIICILFPKTITWLPSVLIK
jgi:tripartite ATP-independent transporter DctM subunit